MLSKFLALRGLLGGNSGGSGAGFATGTITFAERQSNTSSSEIRVTHNLGYVPNNLLYFVVDSTSIDTSNRLLGERKMGFEYISSEKYIVASSTNSSTTAANNIQYAIKGDNAQVLYSVTNANESDIGLFNENAYRTGGYIPAGSTIRWIVW